MACPATGVAWVALVCQSATGEVTAVAAVVCVVLRTHEDVPKPPRHSLMVRMVMASAKFVEFAAINLKEELEL